MYNEESGAEEVHECRERDVVEGWMHFCADAALSGGEVARLRPLGLLIMSAAVKVSLEGYFKSIQVTHTENWW